MKNLIFALAVLIATASTASAFECTYNKENDTSLARIKISGENQGAQLLNVKAYANYSVEDGEYAEKNAYGVAEVLNEKPYTIKGTKYGKDYYRFDLTEMKDANDGQIYMPGSLCEINLHIPKQISGDTFYAPTDIHCEQNGGTIVLTCTN